MASEEEMAAYQRLSNGYEPDVTGPLVSRRLATEAIVAEYAQADPIYVTKTKALMEKFPSYRTLKGDGNCGWRALAFGYFEKLLQLRDPDRIRMEMTRLQDFNALINSIGYEEYLYDEFVRQTLDLLEEIAKYLHCQDIEKTLLERFNDEAVSSAIITHFRLITSGWMKSHANLYKDFLLDGTIDQYRAAYIDPFQVEIEHLGMQACIDAILKPVGIAVEVSYLDRSNSGEANTICWPADIINGRPNPTTLRLLYRPGHYDILYDHGAQDIDNVYLMMQPDGIGISQLVVSNDSYGNVVYDGLDLSAIPGFSSLNLNPIPPDPVYMSSINYRHGSYSPDTVTSDPVVTRPSAAPMGAFHNPLEPCSEDVFRRTTYQYAADLHHRTVEPCQTSAMQQAGESTAHYKNKEFQPLIWAPDPE